VARQEHLRARCAVIAEAVPVCEPFSVARLVQRLADRRRRRIHVISHRLPPTAPCGLCISTDLADYIIVADVTGQSRLVRDQIVLHEVSHLLMDHQVNIAGHPDTDRWLLPNLDSGVVRRMLARRRYDTIEEREAETLATLLHQRAGLWRPEPPAATSDPVVRRLGRSLEHG
jgi:hypothetical protein